MLMHQILWTSLLLNAIHVTYSHENFNAIKSFRLKEDGAKHYELIVQKLQIPKFGECWKSAVEGLEEGCNGLSEFKQSQLALSFTDCFLFMSGEDKYNCGSHAQVVARQKCIKQMSDRAFNVYTEFYTHTQNICFFLKSNVWQESAEITIERLTSTSQHIGLQLEEVQGSHEAIIKKQIESLNLQQNLVQNGINLAQILQESRTSVALLMQELRESTAQQQGALGDLSQRLAALQAWAIGEVSWIESLIFYVLGVSAAYMMTSLPRSHDARAWTFLLLSLGVALEQLLHHLVMHGNTDHTLTLLYLKEDLYYWIWRLRALNVALCIAVYCYFICTFTDYTRANHQLLTTIHKQILGIANELHDGADNVEGDTAAVFQGSTNSVDGSSTPLKEERLQEVLLRRRLRQAAERHQEEKEHASSSLHSSHESQLNGSPSLHLSSLATVHSPGLSKGSSTRRGRPPLTANLAVVTIEQESPWASPAAAPAPAPALSAGYNLRSGRSSTPRSRSRQPSTTDGERGLPASTF